MTDELRQAAKRIAIHLADWTLLNEDGPRTGTAYLVGPENTRVLVSQPWNQKGRIQFSISLDNGLHNFEPYHAERPQATVSEDREPRAAARDVKRRCLDPAVPYVRELREKKAASDSVKATRWGLLERLAEAIGGEVVKSYHDAEDPLRADARRGEHDCPCVEMEVTSGECLDFKTYEYGPDRVSMEIRYLSQEDAATLCQWLRFKLWPENGQQGRLL